MNKILREPARRNWTMLMEGYVGVSGPSGFGIFLPSDEEWRGEKVKVGELLREMKTPGKAPAGEQAP